MGFGRCYLSGFFTIASTMAVWLWAAKPSQKDRDGEYVSLQGNDITALEQDYLEPVISIIWLLPIRNTVNTRLFGAYKPEKIIFDLSHYAKSRPAWKTGGFFAWIDGKEAQK